MSDNVQNDLRHIRKMMEQSSSFISLSGLSGVVAGIAALIGAVAAYCILDAHQVNYFDNRVVYSNNILMQLFKVALIVLVAAIGFGILFTVQKSRRNGLTIWTSVTRKLIQALAVPLMAGGLFCIAVACRGYFEIVVPATLIFYGLALINAARYTYSDVQNLGYCETALGVIAMFVPAYGLVFWALGFGILHIVYGLLVYRKYK